MSDRNWTCICRLHRGTAVFYGFSAFFFSFTVTKSAVTRSHLATMCLRDKPPALTSVLSVGKRVLVAITSESRRAASLASHVPMIRSDLKEKEKKQYKGIVSEKVPLTQRADLSNPLFGSIYCGRRVSAGALLSQGDNGEPEKDRDGITRQAR